MHPRGQRYSHFRRIDKPGKYRYNRNTPPWRNWHTRQVEDLCSQGRGGSSPLGGMLLQADGWVRLLDQSDPGSGIVRLFGSRDQGRTGSGQTCQSGSRLRKRQTFQGTACNMCSGWLARGTLAPRRSLAPGGWTETGSWATLKR